MANKNIQMEFSVPVNDYQRIVDSDPSASPVEVFRKLAEFFFHNYANGGITLKPSEVVRLSKSIGKQVQSADDIVKSVEVSKENEDGQFTFKFSLDPSIVESYAGYARDQGISMRQFMEDCFQQVIFNGWLYEVDPHNKLISLCPSDYNTLVDILGHGFTGHDIVKAVSADKVEA